MRVRSLSESWPWLPYRRRGVRANVSILIYNFWGDLDSRQGEPLHRVMDMAADLDRRKADLRRKLARLDSQQARIEEQVQAIRLLKRASADREGTQTAQPRRAAAVDRR